MAISGDLHATIMPSDENASPMKISQWSSRVLNMHLSSVATFQRLTICIDASPVEISGWPSETNICCLFPVAASQSKMVLSRNVEAIILLSDENAARSEWCLSIGRARWANTCGP